MNDCARKSALGLLVGDALGSQFFGEEGDAKRRIMGREIPDGPWGYTDDTFMALSVLDELYCHGQIDQDSLASRFSRRYIQEPARGYGAIAYEILGKIAAGARWQDVSSLPYEGAGSKGNGSAMRVAPIGAYFYNDLHRAADEAAKSSVVTHTNGEAIAGAVAVAVAAGYSAQGGGSAEDLFSVVLALTPDSATRVAIAEASRLPWDTPPEDAARVLGSGQKVLAEDTVPFVIWCAAYHLGCYEEAFWATVAGLGDRDTTCAMVGGIVASSPSVVVPEVWVSSCEPANTFCDSDILSWPDQERLLTKQRKISE